MPRAAEIILYLTRSDAEVLREWVNSESDVAWIVKGSQAGRVYTWKAVDRLDQIDPQTYCIWHKASGPLTIPSGRLDVPASEIPDPFEGWTQTLKRDDATNPWFGGNLPGPYAFRFREQGRSGSLGRSEFAWGADHYRSIGKPAHPDATRWWRRLQRFVQKNSTRIVWPHNHPTSRLSAFVFPDAQSEMAKGRPVDNNPWWGS